MRVSVIATGIANTASVEAAFMRLGAEVEHTTDAVIVERARAVVLPGVGSFGAGMEVIRRLGLDDLLRERVRQGRATLAVCLGLQLLCRGSEESPGVEGLGVLDAVARRFPDTVSVPQFGWNGVRAGEGSQLIEDGYAYFANSYRLGEEEGAPGDGWACAMTDYAGPFIAAIERGAVLGCQFHPEVSGAWGQALLERWLARVSAEAGSC
ncbi:MAG: imidazole glycerol phosphate synthase subunit HisH [Leptolyngbya sp. PLA3]|nr:MAG: imidazole glycerol phosphate synthase subunit HisH [Cyanobacteria bacterium CYA]MCE7969282.1 imidazole glycerol phosphate synthase subunit HisH [Leptolyngbya sp. PL-A3]